MGKDTDGGSTHLIATSTYAYDGVGRLTDLTHVRDTTTFADYNWTYDAHGRVTGMQFTSLVGDDGNSNYTYDNTDQLTATDHDYQTDEASSFDENGNQTGTGYTTGADNRLTADGTFNYAYDNEGRRTSRTRISSASADDYTTEYTYAHHSRLKVVEFKNNAGTVTKSVSFVYDVFDRRIARTFDADGAGSGQPTTERFIFDPQGKLDPATRTALHDVLLVIDGDDGIKDRYLQGPGIDQTLADEQYASPSEQPTAIGDLFYLLADSLGTIRDVIQWDETQQIVLVKNHLTYDAWGAITGETDTSLNTRYGFQGRERDEPTGLNYHRQRWYDTQSKTWITPDPSSFKAGDTNLYRPMGNGLTNAVDPSGLQLNIPRPQNPYDNQGKAMEELSVEKAMLDCEDDIGMLRAEAFLEEVRARGTGGRAGDRGKIPTIEFPVDPRAFTPYIPPLDPRTAIEMGIGLNPADLKTGRVPVLLSDGTKGYVDIHVYFIGLIQQELNKRGPGAIIPLSELQKIIGKVGFDFVKASGLAPGELALGLAAMGQQASGGGNSGPTLRVGIQPPRGIDIFNPRSSIPEFLRDGPSLKVDIGGSLDPRDWRNWGRPRRQRP